MSEWTIPHAYLDAEKDRVIESLTARVAELEADGEMLRAVYNESGREIERLRNRAAELAEAGNYLAAEAENDWNSGCVSVDLRDAVYLWRKTLAGRDGDER